MDMVIAEQGRGCRARGGEAMVTRPRGAAFIDNARRRLRVLARAARRLVPSSAPSATPVPPFACTRRVPGACAPGCCAGRNRYRRGRAQECRARRARGTHEIAAKAEKRKVVAG